MTKSTKSAALLIDTTVIDRLALFFPATSIDGVTRTDTTHVLASPSEHQIKELLGAQSVVTFYDPTHDSTTFAALHNDEVQLLVATHVQDGTGAGGISRFSTITFAGSEDLADFVETHGVVKSFDSIKLFLGLLGDNNAAMDYLDKLHAVGLDTSRLDYVGMVLPAGETPPVIEELFGAAAEEIAANDSGVAPTGEEVVTETTDTPDKGEAKATWFDIAIGITVLVGVATVAGYAGKKAGEYVGEKIFGRD